MSVYPTLATSHLPQVIKTEIIEETREGRLSLNSNFQTLSHMNTLKISRKTETTAEPLPNLLGKLPASVSDEWEMCH